MLGLVRRSRRSRTSLLRTSANLAKVAFHFHLLQRPVHVNRLPKPIQCLRLRATTFVLPLLTIITAAARIRVVALWRRRGQRERERRGRQTVPAARSATPTGAGAGAMGRSEAKDNSFQVNQARHAGRASGDWSERTRRSCSD